MNDCDAHKAFTLLWSVTDKVFEHVADIRNLLETTCIPVTGRSSDDPPPYESSTSEHLIDQLKEKVNCLEELNKQRKLLYDQYADKVNECDQVETARSEEKQQLTDKGGEFTHPDSTTLRDAAIKTLRSFLRSGRAAFVRHHELLVQIRHGLSGLSENCFKTQADGQSFWYADAEKKFYSELKLMANFVFQTSNDGSSLLRDGKKLGETIMSVSHDPGEETSKLMKRVQESYQQAEKIVVPTFFDLICAILHELPYCVSRNKLKPVLNSVVEDIEYLSDRYLKAVSAYQDALQDLADLLVP